MMIASNAFGGASLAATAPNFARRDGPALRSAAVATHPAPDTVLHPLSGPERSLSQLLTTFHLVLVVVDPFTHESAWLLVTAARVLETFRQADCRVGWLVAGDPDECRAFLGPNATEFNTFADADRTLIKALGLQFLPAIVHLGMDATVIDSAEGWHPAEWRRVTEGLAKMVHWKAPHIPGAKDPAPFPGTPALT
jgi:hypothetical protein